MSYQDLKRKYKNNIENNEEKKSYENLKGEYYSSSVDDSYIKSFISDSRGFLSKASKDYDTLKYGNARSLYGDKQNTADELNTRAKRIRSVLNHNKDKYAEQDYNDLIKYLDAYDTDSKNIINAFKSKSDYFGQWENEESYNYWTEQEEKKKKYSSMTDDELETEIERLKESKKGNAFTNFAMKFVGAQQEVNSNTNLYSKGVSNEEHNQNVDFDISLINNEKNNRKYKQIDALPDNVKSLINEYTALDRTKEEESLEDDVMLLVNQLSGTSGNYNLDKGSTRRTEIAKELETLGVDNWQELVEYNRIRSDEEYYRPVKERFKEDATEHPVLSSLTTIPASVGKFMGSVKTIESALQGGDAPINPNSPYFMMNDYVNTTRQAVMDNYDWNGKITDIDWFDQLYSTAMSAGDSVFASSFGGSGWVGGSVLGISAMSDTAQEIALNGGSKEQALLTGLLAGANEMLWEKISLGNFNALKEKGIRNLFSKNGLKTAVGNVLKSVGINFSEELNTEAANLIVDYLVNGGAGSYAQAYQAYRSAGYSDTDSRSKARVDMIKQVGEAGFSGALQGLFMGSGGTAFGAGAQKSAYNTAAKNMTEDEITTLQEQARGLGMNEKDIDVGSAGPWGEAPSTKKVANLIGAVDEAQTESERQKVIDTAKSYGLNVSLYNTKTETGLKDLKKSIANIEKEITAIVNDKADNIYKTAIADRIEELGESRGKALYIADSYMHIVDGKTLDQYREAALNSKAAETAIKEYNSYGEDTPQWVVEAKQKVENVYKDIEKRFIKPVNNDSNAENNDNSNAKSTEKGIDNTVKSLNNAQIPVASAVVSGENTKVEGIGTVSEKGATVIADGKEVDIKNVNFDNPLTAAAYNFASSMETSEKAKAALSLYNPKLDRSTDFRTAFNEYYNAGLKGIGSFNDVDKYYTFAHSLPESWREAVFNAGRSNKVYESGVNKLYKNRNLSKNQKWQLKVLDLLGKKYGISFLVFDSLGDNNGALNGLQIAGTNKVAVSLDADGKLYLRTAGHECFHIIEEWNPKAAAELTEKIINYLKQSEGYNYAEQVKRYAKTYGVDETTADGLSLIHSEMAADSMFDVFSNEKFVKDIVTENRTLAQKIKDFLTDLISELREMINHFHASEEMNALRSQTAVLEDINSSFISALDTATKSMKETLSDKTKNTATKDGVRYSPKVKNITPGMSEVDRAEVLKNVQLNIVEYTGNEELNGKNVLKLKSSYNSEASKILRSLGEKFGVFRGYYNENVELVFDYSRGSLNESVHKQGDISTNFYDFARMLYVFDEVINNAVPIEVHTDKYIGTKREDRNLKYDYVLFSAFSDGKYIIPVELHIKEYKTQKLNNKLHVSVTLGKIKIEDNVKVQTADENQRNNTQLSSVISLPQLISKINPEYGNFYKYIPKSLLSKSQQVSKQLAESDEEYRLMVMRGEDVSHMLKEKAAKRGYTTDFSYRMDHRAPNAKNDTCITEIDRAYGGDGSIYSSMAAYYYGDGRKYDYKAINVIKIARNSPDKLITIYRAVPTNVKDTRVRNGDWVTIVKDYAEEHGWRMFDDDYRIIENKVPAKYLFTDGNSIHEFGYDNRNVNEVYKNTENNIKLIEPTYDDRGQLIPLSKRFDESNSDPRYSIKLTQKSQRTLDENPELKNVLQDLQHELSLTKGFVPEGKVIHKYAAKLKKDNLCSMNVAEIESDLREIYSVLSSMSGSEGYEYAADLTLNLAKKMLDSSRVLDDLNAEKKELRQKLTTAVKGHKWYLSPEMRAEIEYHYDSYGNFHNKTFGRGFSFSENSTDYLDSDWSELCAAVPELLDSDTPAVEQPLAIVEAFSATEYEYGLFDDYQYDSQAKYIAADIMNNLAAVPEADTLVGKIKSAEYDRIARLKSENAEKISELKKKYAEDIERTALEEKTRYKLQIKQKLESEKAAKARKSIETTMVRLSDMLAHGTKSRHIPLKLIDTVRDLCYSITLNRASQAKLGDNLNKVEALYAALNEGKDGVDGEPDNQFLKNAYDEYVHNLIHQLNTQLRHKSIGDMTLEELILVDETVKAVAQRVIRGNELHIESKNEGVEETAQAISGELGTAKVKRYYKTDALNKTSDKFDLEKWKFLKPVYAWRMIGSETFSELMNNIRKGEDTWAVDIAEAREKILSIGEKYHKDVWADDKKELTLESGDTFTFSIQQLMMLYVASQREQYIPHLIGHKRGEKTDSMKGGFVFEDAYKVIEDRKGNSKGAKTRAWRKRDAGTHHLTESDLNLFAETLTAEQKAYANEMRDYLAKGLAVKGNEITRQLYDMNKFVEDKYFPIKVAREFLDGTMKEPEVRSVLSTSVMKDLQENANNPILLRNFDDMWAEHVQQMAMFHSFALPLDDFTRVFNCRSSNGSPASVKSRIETAYGKGAVSYIENFIKDVNGGVHASATPTVMNKAFSLFKKGAVFASASVAIQQPSAIARALAEVDTKYFAKTTFTKRDYDELIKYAPIARVKSMGFFDNSIGQSTKEWLLSREYKGLWNKSKAMVSDSSYRDNFFGWLPGKADEKTWCHLWNAVKAETADKYKLSGEELLKKSGKRFAEVVELTQVYDSVFSKSEYMRSKDTGAKMSMAFMAEPTTALNMLVDAAANLKHGDKKQGGRYIGAFVASVVFNNILKALVTAARDDDEEKTYVEKYVSSVAGGIVNDLNPLTLLPWVKDVLSIFNGYSIERADMSLVQDLYEAVESLGSDTESGLGKFFNLAGALAAFLGLPVKNVVRDVIGAYNFAAGIFGFEKENEDGEKVPVQKSIFKTSGEGIKKALKDEFSEGFLNKVKNFVEETFFGTADEQLYNAIKQGNYKAYEKLFKEEYESDSEKVNSAIRNGLVEYDERVTQAAEARRDGNATLYGQCVKGLSADGFSNENIRKSVDKVYNELTQDGEEESTDKAYSLYTYEDLNNAIETGGEVQTVIDDIVSAAVQNGKTEETAKENIRNQVTSYWKPLYLEASEYEQEEIKELLDGTNLYSDLDETLYRWELSYTTEKYKTLYVESSQSEKQRIISELEATGLYDNAEKTAKGWEVAVLKEEYKSATSPTEKERIKAEIWNTGYYKYYSNMSKALEKLDSDE